MIQINDFVVLLNPTSSVVAYSVGIVLAEESNGYASVFFLGKKVTLSVLLSNLEFVDVKKTGKPHPKKICNVCHILKTDFEDFDINQTDAAGRKTTRPSCKDCRATIDGIDLLPEEKAKHDANKPELYFVFPICQKGSIPDITAKVVRDHDHHTGKAREWLCDSCNTGLGRFKDNIELLQQAIRYLEKHNQNS